LQLIIQSVQNLLFQLAKVRHSDSSVFEGLYNASAQRNVIWTKQFCGSGEDIQQDDDGDEDGESQSWLASLQMTYCGIECQVRAS